jgi:hypothetical protein
MLGVIAGLREWRCYLEGRPFVIETDHQPNTYLDASPPPAHSLKRRARWLAESGGFDYIWKYRPGGTNFADTISRAPQHLRACVVTRPRQPRAAIATLPGDESPAASSFDLLRSADVSESVLDQVGSFVIENLIARLKKGYAAARADPQQRSALATLTVDTAGIYWSPDTQRWVPDCDNLRDDCVDAVHSHPYAGHYGVRRTHHVLSRTFYWPGHACYG